MNTTTDAVRYRFHRSCQVARPLKFFSKACHASCNCKNDDCKNFFNSIECPASCKQCQNHLFSHQNNPKTEVRDISGKGRGLFALEAISTGSFVIAYYGVVINTDEAEQRSFVIDATKYGNDAKYVNHSCSPNLIAKQWRISGKPTTFKAIGFVAYRDINPDEELTLDYGNDYATNMVCLCGSTNCTGFVGLKKP